MGMLNKDISAQVLKEDFYPMVKSAASFIVKEGPVTEQERWEENSGFSPSTLAAEITALICAAHWAKERGKIERRNTSLRLQTTGRRDWRTGHSQTADV